MEIIAKICRCFHNRLKNRKILIAIFTNIYYNSNCKKNLPFKNFFYEPLINYLYSPRNIR